MLLNREKLAELFGCSLRTVDEYRRQGMPGEAPARPGGQWRFESATVIEWLRSRERTSALGEIAGISEVDAKRRKLAAEAAIAEHELATLQGSAVSVADWQAATAKMVSGARAKLLGIGAAVGPELAIEVDPVLCEAIVQGAINEALEELSSSDIQIEYGGAEEPESGDSNKPETVGTAPGPDGERVGRRGKTAKSRV
jgi:terminase small subunit / prophage DNA-packing protein